MENGSSTPGRNMMELSRRFPPVFHRKEQVFGRKIPEKSENFWLGILLRWNRRNSPEPTVFLLYCRTWESVKRKKRFYLMKEMTTLSDKYCFVDKLSPGKSFYLFSLMLFYIYISVKVEKQLQSIIITIHKWWKRGTRVDHSSLLLCIYKDTVTFFWIVLHLKT